MDWHAALGVASGVVQIGSVVPYVRDILRGSTRPNVVSVGLWTLLAGIAFVAQISAGASWTIILVGGVTFNCALITVLALCGYGYAKYGWLDWLCLGIGLLSIAAWLLSGNPVIAIVFASIASLISNVPAIAKTYRDPESEHAFSWSLVVVAGILAIASTTQFNLQNLLYPAEDLILNVIIFSLAFFGQRYHRPISR